MESKRVSNINSLDLKSDVVCKFCKENIKMFQFEHYLNNFGIAISFCRDFIQRKECFPKWGKLNQKQRDFVKANFLSNDVEDHLKACGLDDDSIVDYVWKAERMKQEDIEIKDALYFNDVYYFPMADKKNLKKKTNIVNFYGRKESIDDSFAFASSKDIYGVDHIRVKKF